MTRKSILISLLVLASIVLLPSCGGMVGTYYGGYNQNDELKMEKNIMKSKKKGL